ncbi:MAG: bifunctional [glutamine synthetase] adenylyltransferase/[glutamine synthetase]-adenylyl-L-tyrosine phosphorylase [Hyphomonadaceae bacterium]|nr:bifunctional [glutamine synthetase] adenylyltransferase/[glutamine synthetase]-adenylyl-L-tyrosine phosphorylase [Hyphomonadaceae bacterium]
MRADGGEAGAPDWSAVLQAAAAHAPYLGALAARDADVADRIAADGPVAVVTAALAEARAAAHADDFDHLMQRLRIAKRHAHLAIAVADLAGAWLLDDVTGALSDLADASLASALTAAARLVRARGEMRDDQPLDPANPAPGLIVIAMGKHGARELNYSSDIDFSIFYDADALPARGEPRALAVRLTQLVVRALETLTVDGYVFRTDLRLRPDPASTPVAVSLAAAEHYYQSVGQNWERAAFVKARACAGDLAAGDAFLAGLGPYLWRRHLDYAAIADVHAIKRQILARHNRSEIQSGAFDVKLGRGGIRDIELFAQTQQLILGGRDPRVRARGTCAALSALCEAGAVSPDAAATLTEAYGVYRAVEHRIQMLADEQTHTVPPDAEGRARLAALAGFEDWATLDAALLARRRAVALIDARLFAHQESLADPLGSLIFTGVENDPETLETLRKLGFVDPVRVSETVRGWHHGRIRATRAERAREILTAIMPRLLRAIAESGDADTAFARFDDFLSGLNAGVQALALLQAQPRLLTDLADVFGLAPRLAEDLSRRPALLDAMVEPAFTQPLRADPPGGRSAALRRLLQGAAHSGVAPFEAAINAARRFHREEALRIALQVLQGRATAAEAGEAYADLAEACVDGLAQVAGEEMARLHGACPGAYVVLALGKFGGREMNARSDLDVMLVYDAPAQATSDGARPLPAADYYARLTQRLISALSAPTEEGLLYDVDMQLRPSGSKGPVAVRLAAFAHYYAHEAWTWELMALTRARVVAGDGELAARLRTLLADTLAQPRDAARVLADACAMRARMDRDRPASGLWDLKLAPGGVVDVEFIVQALAIARAPAAVRARAPEAMAALVEAGALATPDGSLLRDAWTLYADLQQVLRVCVPDAFDPAVAPARLRALLARVGGVEDFPALETRLAATQATVRALFTRAVGDPGDGNPAAAR